MEQDHLHRDENQISNRDSSLKPPKQISLDDIIKKLIDIESQYSHLLTKYEEQIKVNAELKSEIADIRRQLANGIEHSTSTATNNEVVSESFQEFSERQVRQKNIMIFGSKEDTPLEGQSRRQADTTTATDVILKAYSDAS